VTTLLPGPVGLWTGALEALEVPAAREQVAEPDAQGWDALWFGEEAIRARVREHPDAGADRVCLQVLGEDRADVPREDWARLAPVAASLQ
jgi:hypothetical protein